MAKLEITSEQERLARYAKAMGHPTRIAILIFSLKETNVFSETYMKCCRLRKLLCRNI